MFVFVSSVCLSGWMDNSICGRKHIHRSAPAIPYTHTIAKIKGQNAPECLGASPQPDDIGPALEPPQDAHLFLFVLRVWGSRVCVLCAVRIRVGGQCTLEQHTHAHHTPTPHPHTSRSTRHPGTGRKTFNATRREGKQLLLVDAATVVAPTGDTPLTVDAAAAAGMLLPLSLSLGGVDAGGCGASLMVEEGVEGGRPCCQASNTCRR